MVDRIGDSLRATIKAVVDRVRKFKGRTIGEQNTKASLIEPILEAVGWDIRNPDEVHREFRPTSKDSPVDYALKILRKPRLFVEAKGLDENLSDRKWVAQVLGYATVAGVEWCVLTDGDEYSFYNATAAVDAEEKLFCRLRLSEAPEHKAIQVLQLLSRHNMEENLLDALWSEHFVDRQVRESLRMLFENVDRRLVRLIRDSAPKLSPKEVEESLQRLDIRIDAPSDRPKDEGQCRADVIPSVATRSQTSEPTGPTRQRRRLKKRDGSPSSSSDGAGPSSDEKSVNLSTLVEMNLITAPLRLFRRYKGVDLQATLCTDGSIEFAGEKFPTASAAASKARETVLGVPSKTNGWIFWQFTDAQGVLHTLDDVRRQFIDGKPTQG